VKKGGRNRNYDLYSWHWYAHGVSALEGNESESSPIRRELSRSRDDDYDGDFDPTRGVMDSSEHRRNAAIGASWRAAMRVAARRRARGSHGAT